ncbi:MAG: P-loop NTPase fold protein, partial [Actinomycetota bacterium]
GSDGTIRVWNRSSEHQVRGTDLGGMGTTRPLAGLRSDEPSDVDLLGIGTEVEMMATLVAAASTEAPLAIGLLGDWGSGKSSFMLQMETQVRELADASASNLGQSEFVANVCQVRFNAWHYSDDQIWSGLVEHLFRALASGGNDGSRDPVADPEKAAKVGERLHEATAEYEQANRDLNRLANKPRPVGLLAGLGSVGELVALPGILVGEIWRDVRSSWRSLVGWLVAVAALGAAVAGFLWTRDFLWRTILTLAGLGAVVGKVWRPLKRLHAWLLDSAGRQKRRLEERRDAAHKRIATLRGELALVSASERLHRFVADRQGAGDYTPYRGLLGLVYRDLRQLNENLKAALQEWESLKPPRPMPPLQRIVLYIDDLDRCPPKRVVDVLAAVHLLLAMRVFVVVVAVDVRWLELSLKHHFTELLGHRDLPEGVIEAAEPVGTPWDYLEKIFQITYALRPMGSRAAAAYLQTLLPSESEMLVVTPPSAQAEAESITPQLDTADSTPPDEANLQDAGEVLGLSAHSRSWTGDGLKKEATQGESFPVSALPPRAGPASVRNLQPEGLRMRAREREFIPALAALLPTPRAAKRLINIYRLIRIGITEGDLEAFVGDEIGGPYQAVGLLIAIVVGHPRLVHGVLGELHATTVPDFFTLLGELHKACPPGEV